jgi:UDP-glucose 4-epimerase
MKVLVTGSAGHLGEALMRTLPSGGHVPIGIDICASPYTDHVGSITDREFVRRSMQGIEGVVHAATLHKPHLATHTRQEFVDVNITGTLNLLEEAVAARVRAFVYTSTTSAFGAALNPPPGQPAAWITEDVTPIPKNIYGVTKLAGETLCEMFQRKFYLPCLILRISRFFPEQDDNRDVRDAYDDDNVKANEFLYRRVEIEDVVDAQMRALDKAQSIRFARYIISATTPFSRTDCAELGRNAPAVVARCVPEYAQEYARRGWTMFPTIDRVYANELARRELGWRPQFDFRVVVARLRASDDFRSALARSVGSKGYHRGTLGTYPFD